MQYLINLHDLLTIRLDNPPEWLLQLFKVQLALFPAKVLENQTADIVIAPLAETISLTYVEMRTTQIYGFTVSTLNSRVNIKFLKYI